LQGTEFVDINILISLRSKEILPLILIGEEKEVKGGLKGWVTQGKCLDWKVSKSRRRGGD